MTSSFPSSPSPAPSQSAIERGRGCSSVGRAVASQATGRGFESLRPLSLPAGHGARVAARIDRECPYGLTAVARILGGVSVARVRALIHHGPLRAFRSGRQLLVRPKHLQAYLRAA